MTKAQPQLLSNGSPGTVPRSSQITVECSWRSLARSAFQHLLLLQATVSALHRHTPYYGAAKHAHTACSLQVKMPTVALREIFSSSINVSFTVVVSLFAMATTLVAALLPRTGPPRHDSHLTSNGCLIGIPGNDFGMVAQGCCLSSDGAKATASEKIYFAPDAPRSRLLSSACYFPYTNVASSPPALDWRR